MNFLTPALVETTSRQLKKEIDGETSMSVDYHLTLPAKSEQKLSIGWLWLGLGSLIIAGIFSILLVLSRVPQAQDFIPWIDFFHTSIVIHVDMSVLIWFLSYGALLWTFTTRRLNGIWGWTAWTLALTGTLIIGISPFLGAGDPLMNNYVPVLRHPLFFTGLILFGAGIALQVAGGLKVDPFNYSAGENTLRIGIYSALLVTAMAIASLYWAYREIPLTAEDHPYFEYLFWGGGHVVQFAYTQLMLVSWVWLYSSLNKTLPASPKVIAIIFIIGALPVLLAPVIHYFDGSFSLEYRADFAALMKWFGGIAALPIGLILLIGFFKDENELSETQKPMRNALLSSILLFGVGGALGFMTTGVNTIIPAHYHGSIVGVTLAFMGLTYYLLPRLGFATPVGKLARRQPYIYASGQLIHISALAIGGAMGIQRKTAGAAQGLDTMSAKAVMGIMGLGGLIAIIGGILFLLVTIKAIMQAKAPASK